MLSFKLLPTAERTSSTVASNNYVFKRSLKAYDMLPLELSGHVLEIGSGCGYGLPYVSQSAQIVISLDKCERISQQLMNNLGNVVFMKCTLPPMTSLPSDHFDAIVCYQFIEHIREDITLLKDIRRVLKPNGRLYLSTPNALMTLSRNPWHIREYTPQQLKDVIEEAGLTLKKDLGVFGSKKVMTYYDQNKEHLKNLRRFDIFNIEQKGSSAVWRGMYDLMNYLNRIALKHRHKSVNDDINLEDFEIMPVNKTALDLLYVCTKTDV